ncbi:MULTISPECIES: UbiA family prenyltransferase [unclassified Streptomyces]|uniref:UbiA family prenyltransferase n=1 Tax=unclassified Streptomyces TaxID=2593676 RepID=UPI000DC79E5A|nr:MULTISPECIES: UbiA family prenyltransferase [unclassified Streptomyces]AWZ04266.1 1,4-dihydroxy-2-naphthoate prenyltransferase [Streptomyces sp. ICC4]AWZ13567.1 1,4-dihydroxy-2-naphthoate prenyltransferase [Streptomyces sp. ICC1]
MTDTLAPAPPAAPRMTRPRAYAQLAKLRFFDYYLAALVVWTMLPPDERLDPRVLLTLVVLTLGWVGVCASAVAFDDVTGFRDGSDLVNYDPAQAQLRNRELKPLLDGHLTVRQALGFGYAALLFGITWAVLGALIAPHRPLWALALLPVLVGGSVQYSYGLRLSHRYGQELVLILSTSLVAVIPFGLVHGEMTGLALLESVLIGLWSVLVSLYSNINDRDGDIASGRKNLATMLRPPVYAAVIAAFSLAETAAILWACAVGAVPWWFLLALAPVIALRVHQLRTGLLKGQVLVARKLGGQAHRLGVALLLVANLLAVR